MDRIRRFNMATNDGSGGGSWGGNGSFWIGGDGKVYVAGDQGTNAAGTADANTNSYWTSRGYSQINDPNPQGGVLGTSTNNTNDTGAYTGGSTRGSTGVSSGG